MLIYISYEKQVLQSLIWVKYFQCANHLNIFLIWTGVTVNKQCTHFKTKSYRKKWTSIHHCLLARYISLFNYISTNDNKINGLLSWEFALWQYEIMASHCSVPTYSRILSRLRVSLQELSYVGHDGLLIRLLHIHICTQKRQRYPL